MRWDENTIQDIKEANDVLEIVGQHLNLKRSGSNYKALCPFHQEKTPSFMVNPGKQIFHCFGCDTGGDVIRFIMLHEGLPFTDAVRKLAGRAGIDLPEKDAESGARRDKKDVLYRANRLASEYYSEMLLKDPQGSEARDYLGSRGIHSDVCRTYGMGFAPPGWRSLGSMLKKEEVRVEAAIECGLMLKGDGAKDPYDRFRNRIVFPIRDLAGRILGFGGRVLGEELPKYVNTPETPVYRKGDSLFGVDVAAASIREKGLVILVEGYLDVIALHQAGIRNVVGVLGTALTKEQARRIKRLTTKCVLIFDSDEAGTKAALRSGMIFLEEGFTCLVAPLDADEDPDSFLRKNGPEKLIDRISDALSIVIFAMEEAKKDHPGDNVGSRAQVLDAIAPYLAKIEDRAKLGVYLREVADDLRIEQHDLRAKLTSVSERKPGPSSQIEPEAPIQRWEELLVHIMIRDPSTTARVREVVDARDFVNPAMSGVVEKIYSGVTLGILMDTVEDNLKDTLSGWALEDPVEGKEKALEDCLRRVAVRKLDNAIQKTTERLEKAAEREDDQEYRELTEEWKRLQDKRRMVKAGQEPGSDATTEESSGGESRE